VGHGQSTEKLKCHISIFNRVNHCLAALGQAGVQISTSHSIVFARLASEAIYFVVLFLIFPGPSIFPFCSSQTGVAVYAFMFVLPALLLYNKILGTLPYFQKREKHGFFGLPAC